MEDQEYCLKWNNHEESLLSVFEELFDKESYSDITILCEAKCLNAHKVVLCSCSPYFEAVCKEFDKTHPVILIKDVSYDDMKALLHFMYKGEVNVPQNRLQSLVSTAESLKIKGLALNSDQSDATSENKRKRQDEISDGDSDVEEVQESSVVYPTYSDKPHDSKRQKDLNIPSSIEVSRPEEYPQPEDYSHISTTHAKTDSDRHESVPVKQEANPDEEVLEIASPEPLNNRSYMYEEKTLGTNSLNTDESVSYLLGEETTQGFQTWGKWDERHTCMQCGRNYAKRDKLQRHQQFECGKEPQFMCPYCQRRIKRKDNLNKHIRSLHAGMPLV